MYGYRKENIGSVVSISSTGINEEKIVNVVYDLANANIHKDTTTSDSYTITSYDVNDNQNNYYKQIGSSATITRTNCNETRYLKITTTVNDVCEYNSNNTINEQISSSIDDKTTIFKQGDTDNPTDEVNNYEIVNGRIVIDQNTSKPISYQDPYTD